MSITAQKPLNSTYPANPQTIGEHIKRKRRDLGLLQKEVAVLLGVSKTSISNWETYGRKPVVTCFPAIIKFLGYVPFEEGESIGERIWYYRAIRGMSHRELADNLGLDEGTVNDWENNKPNKMFTKIEKAFQGILDFS